MLLSFLVTKKENRELAANYANGAIRNLFLRPIRVIGVIRG